jgi:mono/diheme cytochrome c family protein
MRLFKFSAILFACTMLAAACAENNPTGTNSAAPAGRPVVVTTEPANTATPAAPIDEMAAIRATYAQKCVACHKEDGSGGKVTIEGETINAENLRTEKMKKMSDAKYIEYIEKGVPDEGMPAFKGKLTDQEISQLVKYIRTEFQNQPAVPEK